MSVVGTPPVVGASSQFTALAVLADGTNSTVTSTAVWSSSNTAVATVASGGVVTGVAPGSTTITAAYGGASGQLTITVAAAPTFTVSGFVNEAGTFKPIASATVTISGGVSRTATTNANGLFSIAGVPGVSISITISAAGYVSQSYSLNPLDNTNASRSITLDRSTPCPAIGFDELTGENTAVITSSMCGLTLQATTTNWAVVTGYGKPAPSIRFPPYLGSPSSDGELRVTAGGQAFTLQSVDIGGAVAYTFTGMRGSSVIYSVTNPLPNNLGGDLVTIRNPQPLAVIDTLIIHLTNGSFPGALVLLDNIRVSF